MHRVGDGHLPAAHSALASLGHPVRQLLEPPAALPRAGMEAAMGAFVRAGQAALGTLSTDGIGSHRAAARARRRHCGRLCRAGAQRAHAPAAL